MNNKSLLIKAPSSIDADLPVWNALKITWKVYKTYNGSDTLEYQTGPFNTDDKFEITEQEAGTAVAISKKNFFGGTTISPSAESATQFTVTVTGDDVYNIKILSFTPGAFRIIKVDSMFGEGLDTITNLTNLTYLDLTGINTQGDIAKLKTLTNLTSLDLSNTKVSGNIAELKTLTNIRQMWLYNTNISGDVAELKTLTNLIILGITGTKVSGDISVLSPTMMRLSDSSNQKFSWPSPTARSSKTNIPLYLTGGCNFGDDLDNFLIDQAACTNYSGNTYGKSIEVKGNRTSKSDSAIETLQNNGWTVKIS